MLIAPALGPEVLKHIIDLTPPHFTCAARAASHALKATVEACVGTLDSLRYVLCGFEDRFEDMGMISPGATGPCTFYGNLNGRQCEAMEDFARAHCGWTPGSTAVPMARLSLELLRALRYADPPGYEVDTQAARPVVINHQKDVDEFLMARRDDEHMRWGDQWRQGSEDLRLLWSTWRFVMRLLLHEYKFMVCYFEFVPEVRDRVVLNAEVLIWEKRH